MANHNTNSKLLLKPLNVSFLFLNYLSIKLLKKCSIFTVIMFFGNIVLFAQQSRIDSLKSKLLIANKDDERIEIVNKIADQYLSKADYLTAMPFVQQSIQLAERLGLKNEFAVSSDNMGIVLSYVGNYDRALDNYLAALNYWEEVGNKQKIINSYNLIASVYQNQSNYKKQLENCYKKLMIEQEINDKVGIANSYCNIGGVYINPCRQAIKDQDITISNHYYNKIIDYYSKALKIWEDRGDSPRIASLMYSLAFYYDKCNLCEENKLIVQSNLIKPDYHNKALVYNSEALKIYQKIGDDDGVMATYYNLGIFYKNEGILRLGKLDISNANFKLSLVNFILALKYAETAGYKHGIANSNKEIGTVYLYQRNISSASEYLTKSAKIFIDIGYREGIKECYSKLAMLYESGHNYKQAFTYYKLYSDIKDSLEKEANSKSMAEKNIKYEIRKKEDSILYQFKDLELVKEEIKTKNLQLFILILLSSLTILSGIIIFRILKKTSREKRVIERINKGVHHDVKNQFQEIMAFLRLAKNKNDQFSLDEASARISSMAKVHEILYISRRTTDLSMQGYFEDLSNEIKNTFGCTGVVFNISALVTLPTSMAYTLGLIVNELLVNVFKYAYESSQNGVVELSLKKSEKRYILRVTDNGKGIASKMDNNSGFGTLLIKGWVEELKGEFKIIDNNGTQFEMTF